MGKIDKDMTKQTDIKQLEEKLVHLEDQLKRAVADYRNLEKRITDDTIYLSQTSRAQLISRILPALDSLDQAVEGANEVEANSGWLKGVLMAVKQLRQILADEGLVEIPTEGKFDPNLHEAVDVVEGEDGKIVNVSLRGYLLNGKIVRPAKVVVGKKNPVKMSEEAKEEVETEEV